MTQSIPLSQPQSYTRGWIVTFAGIGINLLLGVLYAWSVVAQALTTMKTSPWSKTQAGLPFATSTAVFAITMVFAGRVQDKIGPRLVAMAGGMLMGLGMFLTSWARTPQMMMLTFGVLGGMGTGFGYSATTPPAIKWFPPARKGLIAGLVVAGVGLAAVYMGPLTDWLIKHTDLPTTFRILGGATIVISAILAQFLTNPPAGYVAEPKPAAGAARKAPSRRDTNWPEMLTTPQFYLMWLMFVLAAAPGLMLIANAKGIGREQAHWDRAVICVMVLAAFNTLGRVVGGFVSDLLGRTNTMLLFFVLQAANMVAFAHYTTPAMLICGIALAGLCYGSIFTLMPAGMADFYGVKNLGVNYGILFTAFGVAGVTGTLLGGRVRDLFGSYNKAYLIVAAMLAVAAVLSLITKAPKETETAGPRGFEVLPASGRKS